MDPEVRQGSITVINHMDLLWVDFYLWARISFIMTDVFSKFSVAIATLDQQTKMVTKTSVNRWFYIYGIPSRIHSD